MSLLYFLTLFAIGLAATALLGGAVTIVSHAVRLHLEKERNLQRSLLFERIVQGSENPDWDPELVKAMSCNRPLSADLFSEMSELIRGENRERILALCRQAGIDRWLLRQLASWSSDRRRVAAETLRLFPGEETVAALRATLDDPASAVRLTAALSLAELNAMPPVSILVQKLIEKTREHSLLLQRLLESLAVSQPSEVLDVAKGTIGKPFLRPIAVRALGKAGHLGLSDAIAGLIEDPNPEVRAAALESVASLGDFSAKDRVKQALADSVHFVRVKAIDATRQIELRELVPELVPLLHDPIWLVRFRASEALAAFGYRLSERERRVVELAPAQRGAA